ncbi:oligosaccharide flippase family protein [Candidatus Saccharibacteria bacterium]|nr:oligosaccharide flippase family protein [Candidatus Saccharibacteria bacterium]
MSSNLQRSLIQGVAWTVVSTWLNKAIGIVYAITLLSFLSVYDYGVTELVLSIPALLAFMNLPGLETVVMSDMAKEQGDQDLQKSKFIFTSYMSVRVILGIITWSLLFFSAPYVEQSYNTAIASMFQVLSFTFLFSPIRTAYQILFRVNLQFNLLAFHRIVEEIAKLGVVLLGLYVFELGALAVILAYIASDIVALPMFALFFCQSWRRTFGETPSSSGWLNPLHNLRAHGKWGIFSSYLNIFGQNIRPWIIKFFLGTHAVGIYAAAMGMYQNTASLIPVNQVAAPVVPQVVAKTRALCSLAASVIKYQFIAYILSAVLMLTFLPFLINTFFPGFKEAYGLFALLLLSLVPLTFSGIFETIFFALKAQKNLFFANIMFLLSIVVTLPVALSIFGLYGIALEFFITRTVYTVGRYLRLKKLIPEYRLSMEEILSFTDKDKYILTTILTPLKRFL